MAGKGDGMGAPQDQCYPQKLGDSGNLRGPSYDNDVASDWRRGMGVGQAEGKPGYVKTGPNPKGIK